MSVYNRTNKDNMMSDLQDKLFDILEDLDAIAAEIRNGSYTIDQFEGAEYILNQLDAGTARIAKATGALEDL